MKKLLLVIFATFLFIINITALYAAETEESATTVITKNGKYPTVGSVYTSYRKKVQIVSQYGYNIVKYFTSKTASDTFCNQTRITCGSNYQTNSGAYICTRGNSGTSSQYYSSFANCYKACSGTTSAGASCKQVRYIAIYKNGTVSESVETKYKVEDITGNQYQTADGDDAYCINPGRRYKNNSKYCLVDEFNVNSCQSSNDSDYRCGLAWILLQNVDENGNNSGKYSYGVILTALRMWTAYKSNLDGMDNFGNEADEIDYVADSNFYSVTAKKVAEGYTGAACVKDKAYNGVICSGAEEYKQAFELFEMTRSGQKVEVPGEQGDEVKLKTTEITKKTKKIEAEIPFDLDNPLFAEYKDKISMELMKYNSETKTWEKVAGGKEHTECQKNYCQLVLVEPVCNAKETYYSTEWKVRITIEDYNVGGLIRQYVHCSNPEKYQIMMVLATSKSKCGEPGQPPCEEIEQKGDYVTEPEVTVNCLKDCESGDGETCPNSEMVVRSDTPLTCDGYDSYTKGEKEDPYMNCILNACDETRKQQFDKSEEYGVATDTCRVYCREEIEFFLANKTKVYAGMQFQYDLASKNLTDSEGNRVTPFTVDQKLSAVVLQKRQCTSEIYYDRSPSATNSMNKESESWLERYDAAVKEMVSAWNEWKKWEAIDIVTPVAHEEWSPDRYANYCSGNTCGRSGCTAKGAWLYSWDVASYNISNITTVEKGKKFDVPDPSTASGHSNGIAPSVTSCSSGCSGEPVCTPWCSSGSCTDGSDGDPSEVPNKRASSKQAYLNATLKVAQLIYDLQNCNMYTTSEMQIPSDSWYSSVASQIKKATTDGSSKNTILKEASESIMELFVEYDDANYGAETQFENATQALEEDFGTDYCVNANDKDANCYDYIPNTEKEISSSNKKETHHLVVCTGTQTSAKCYTKNVSWPTNDYATFVSVTETDFWQPKQYHTKVYTGEVMQGSGDGVGSADLGPNVFPVSNDKTSGVTGEYGIHWKFTDVGEYDFTRLREFLYECTYDVYNTTTLYDCDYVDENGNVDWDKCKNTCFEVNETVPKVCIDDNYDADTKGYGFVYRNVDLNDLFPNREPGFNWANSTDIIESIQASSSDIWTDEYLEYSFTLDTQAIKNIRNYNDTKQGIGGYLDNSIYACEIEGDTFKNCRSSFLEEYNLSDGLGVEVHRSMYGGIY